MLKRKMFSAIACLGFLVSGLTGCAEEPEINANRGTDYKFDIVDYLDFKTFGENGNGYLEITQKDISSSNFSTDDDYIAVRKDMDNLNPYYLTDGKNSGIKVETPSEEGLSNGDVVVVSFDLDDDEKYSDINTEEYEYEISGLSDELSSIDLFNSDFITVYGDESNQLHLSKNKNEYEFTDYLDYSVKSNTQTLSVGQTVVDITVELNDDYARENNYTDVSEFLAKEYKMKTDTNGSIVLSQLATPIDFGTVSAVDLSNTLYDYISRNYQSNENDAYISSILNIQKTERQVASAPYECVVVYSTMNMNTEKFYAKVMELGFVDGKITIMNVGNTNEIWNTENANELLSSSNVFVVKF